MDEEVRGGDGVHGNQYRNSSRHRLAEHDMLNWVKANGKRVFAGVMKEPRMGLFRELLALAEENKHVNQYK